MIGLKLSATNSDKEEVILEITLRPSFVNKMLVIVLTLNSRWFY